MRMGETFISQVLALSSCQGEKALQWSLTGLYEDISQDFKCCKEPCEQV